MSIKIFNVKNHRPDGEALRQLSDFSTNDFCGIVGTLSEGSAFTKSGSSIVVNQSLVNNGAFQLIGGGCLLSVDTSEVANKTADGVYAVQVLSDNTDNFTTDISSSVSIISNADVPSTYDGRTVWLSNGFIIPLFKIESGVLTSLAVVKDGKSWEEFLTQSAINDFRNELAGEYTHQVGSTGNNKYGKVANYDFAGDSIYHYFAGNNKDKVLEVTSDNKFVMPLYTTGALYIKDSSAIVDSGSLPIECGGTGGNDKISAQQNLGIFYGNSVPTKNSTRFPVGHPAEGDIYFRILE